MGLPCDYYFKGRKLSYHQFKNELKNLPMSEIEDMFPQIKDEGISKLLWTTGEQQNERYDLSKQVDKIDVEGVEDVDGLHFVDIKLSNGTTENLEVENGVIRDGNYKGQRLDNVIGKDYADKVLSVTKGETKTLEGADLKVGGKGMIGFYGSPKEGKLGIVGQVAESMFGKGSVKTTEIEIRRGGFDGNVEQPNTYSTQHSIDITPEIKAQVEQGQPLFMKSPNGEILGFVQEQPNGSYKIWIDPKTATEETPIHEIAGHIFMPIIKKAYPAMYRRGVELIKGTEYEKRIAKEYPNINKEELVEEALATAIGEKGAELLGSKKKEFVSWLKEFWYNVKSALRLVINSQKLAEMTLDDFTSLIAGSVLHGKELAKIQENENQDNQTDVGGNETSARTAEPTKKNATPEPTSKEGVAEKVVSEPNVKTGREKSIETLDKAAESLKKLLKAKGLPDDVQVKGTSSDQLVDMVFGAAKALVNAGYDLKEAVNEILDTLIKDGVISDSEKSDIEKTLNPKIGEAEEEREKKLRGHYKTMQNNINQPQGFNDFAKDNPLTYEVITNEETLNEAKGIVKEKGIEGAYDYVMNGNSDKRKRVAVGFLLYGQIFNEALKAKENGDTINSDILYDRFLKLQTKLGEIATEAGQDAQIFSLFTQPFKTLEGTLYYWNKLMEKANAANAKQYKKDADRIAEKTKTTIEKNIGELEESVKSKVNKSKPKTTKPPKVEKLKLSEAENARKSELGKKFSGMFNDVTNIPVLIASKDFREYAKLVMKDAAFDVINFANKLKEDLGELAYKKLEPHLSDVIKNANSELGEEIVKEGVKNLDTTIAKIARKHYTEIDETGRSLAEKLADEAGLSDRDAKEYADFIEKEFQRLVVDRMQENLKREINRKTKGAKPTPQQRLSQVEQLITAYKKGVLDSDTVQKIFASRFPKAKVSESDASFISDTFKKIDETSDPTRKAQLTGEMVKHFNDKNPLDLWKAFDSAWYASVLSGFSTIDLNITWGLSVMKLAALEHAVGEVTKTAVGVINGKKSVKNSAKNFAQAYFSALYGASKQLGITPDMSPAEKAKKLRDAKLPFSEAFNNAMFTIAHGNQLFDADLKGLNYTTYGEIDYKKLSDNKLAQKFLGAYSSFVKGVPRLLNAIDISFASPIKGLWMVPLLEEHYKKQGLSDSEITEQINNDLLKTEEVYSEAEEKAKNDRLNIDLAIKEENGRFVVYDSGKKEKSFATRQEAEAYQDKLSTSGLKYKKGLQYYLYETLPKGVTQKAKTMSAEALLTGEPHGLVGAFYDKALLPARRIIAKGINDVRNSDKSPANKAAAVAALNAVDKSVVFMRVACNLLNITLDYTGHGLVRGFRTKEGITQGYKREEYTETMRNRMKARAVIGLSVAAYTVYQVLSQAIPDDDEDEGQKEKQKYLMDRWNEMYPDQKIKSPLIFSLPKKGDVTGSLDMLPDNLRRFLMANGLAKPFSRFNGETWESYQNSVFSPIYSTSGTYAVWDKYVKNNPYLDTYNEEEKKKIESLLSYMAAAGVSTFVEMSAIKGPQRLLDITKFVTGDPERATESLIGAVLTPLEVLNPNALKQINKYVDGTAREWISPLKDPKLFIMTKIPIYGSFVEGKPKYNIFGHEIKEVRGEKQGKLSQYYKQWMFADDNEKDMELSSYLLANGYAKIPAFNPKNLEYSYIDENTKKRVFLEDDRDGKTKVQVEGANEAFKKLWEMYKESGFDSNEPNTGKSGSVSESDFINNVDEVFKDSFEEAYKKYLKEKGISK